MTAKLAMEIQEMKQMIQEIAKNQSNMSETLKRPREATEEPAKKPKKPRNANCWHVGVRLMQYFANKLEPRHRKGLMRYAKVHAIMQDENFRAFLEKHVDRTKPMDTDFVDKTMIPAMTQECKAMVRTLRALKPADMDALMAQESA